MIHITFSAITYRGVLCPERNLRTHENQSQDLLMNPSDALSSSLIRYCQRKNTDGVHQDAVAVSRQRIHTMGYLGMLEIIITTASIYIHQNEHNLANGTTTLL